MSLRSWLTATAATCLLTGLGFALYGPLLFRAFDGLGTATLPGNGATDPISMSIWTGVAFSRLFGAVVFALGLLLWNLRDAIRPDAQQRVLRGLLLALTAVFLLALIQQYAIWNSVAGWFSLATLVILLSSGSIAYRQLPLGS